MSTPDRLSPDDDPTLRRSLPVRYRRLTFPAVAALAIASLLLGVVAALASGRDTAKPPRVAHVARSAMAAVPRLSATLPVVVDAAPCTPTSGKAPAAEPVPQSLLDAFGVLRRDRAAEDALPAAALTALRARGLEPFDPAAARLLRTTAGGARAWVVPVRDVTDPAAVGLRCALRLERPFVQRSGKYGRIVPARPAVPRAETAPAPAPPAPTAPQPAPAPPATVPTTPAAPAKPAPHPGLAVVALDGAPVGSGGRLEDLVRGREAVAIDPCGGPDRDMLSVSGIVPDGVGAAFLTSPDGTAVRADVKDNAYAFVVPPTKTAEQRYVVWTGGDGTPHVQPLASPVFLGRARCATAPDHQPPTVSPDASGLCGHFTRAFVVPLRPTLPRHAPVPTTPPLLYQAPCALAPATALALPTPPTVRILPKALRVPKRHR
jgi:hypothetical protein